MTLGNIPVRDKQDLLMKALDLINAKTLRDTVKYALQGVERKWKMRQEK